MANGTIYMTVTVEGATVPVLVTEPQKGKPMVAASGVMDYGTTGKVK